MAPCLGLGKVAANQDDVFVFMNAGRARLVLRAVSSLQPCCPELEAVIKAASPQQGLDDKSMEHSTNRVPLHLLSEALKYSYCYCSGN